MVQRAANKLKIFLFFSWIAFQSFGAADLKKETHNRLMEVNSNWASLYDHIEHTFTPCNEQELIQLHLLNVVSYLESQPNTGITKKQSKNRANHISTLRKYAQTGEYPINNLTSFRSPIFIDSRGVHCAVGYLIKESGLGEVAREIADQQLLAYLGDIKHPVLSSWQAESGLSMFELALIQPTYGPPIPVCASETPIEWISITTKNPSINRLFTDENAKSMYGISLVDALGMKQEVKRFSEKNQIWTGQGPQINGQILDLVFCENQLYISVLLPQEEYPHQLLKLNKDKWEKVAHFNGSIISIQELDRKLYVLGYFKKVNDSIASNFVTIDGKHIRPFKASGLIATTYDHMQSSETALFLTSYGQIFKFKDDTIKRLASIQYYQYITDLSLDAWNDTLFVTSQSIQGYNSYSDSRERPSYLNNMLYGQDYPYSSINFTKTKKVNGKMVIAGDFKSSTMMPQINDERVLMRCPESQSAHWFGEGLLYEYEHKFYPILEKGIVLDFVNLNDRIYILRKEGSISYASLVKIEQEIIELRERGKQ